MNEVNKVFTRLYTFSKFTYGHNFIEGEHIRELCQKLEGIGVGLYNRLVVNLPPRHSKTQTCSVNFPAWTIFDNPNKSIIIITYGDDLSEEIGIKIRGIIKEYGALFNVYLSSHTASKTKIKFQDRNGNPYRGGIEALGYKGAITGKDADLIIIDDLIKGPEDALSPTQNKKIVDFYKSAIFTRLYEHSEVIVVSTRWSKTDLAGHLLENSSETWETFIKPAIDEDNNPLWPERFSKDRMATIQEEEGPFWWSALYLQEPEELKGDVFEGEFITTTDYNPQDMQRVVRYWDRASTEQKDTNDPDWTVGLKMALMKDDSLLVLDIVRFRGSPATNETRILKTTKRDGPGVEVFIEQEPGSSGKDSIYRYKKLLTGYKVRGDRPTGSKHIRAIDVAAAVETSKVKFLKGKWNGPLFLEMRAFPYGSHDDQVDTLSGSFNILRKKGRVTVYV